MSNKVVTLVYTRMLGSAHRKAIVAYMADKASDDGRGVFCSKGTIAAETEIARSTVFKTIRDLIAEGVLIEAGNRACKNGATVVYDINLDAIRAMPKVKTDHLDRSASRTPTSPSAGLVAQRTGPPAGPHRSASRTPTGPSAGPKPSLEPSLNTEASDAVARTSDIHLVSKLTHALGFDHQGQTPRYWASPDAALIVARWQTDLGLTSDEVVKVAVANMRAHQSPANGPKILTKQMQDYAAAKNAPVLEPTKGRDHDQKPACDRRAAAADDAFVRVINAAAGFGRPS